jgi:hypothetical protein
MNNFLASTESQGEKFVESTFQQHFVNYKIVSLYFLSFFKGVIGMKGAGKQSFVKHWIKKEKSGYKSKNSNTLFLPQTKDNYELYISVSF